MLSKFLTCLFLRTFRHFRIIRDKVLTSQKLLTIVDSSFENINHIILNIIQKPDQS